MKKITIILLFFFPLSSIAQDVHFSQFHTSSFLLNPALIGASEHDYKAVLQRRSQWESVSVPFSTFLLSLEQRDVFPTQSVGLQFINDIAGDSRFKTSGINLGYSKLSKVSEDNIFRFGIQLGLFQRSIVFDDLIFIDNENLKRLDFIFSNIDLGFSNHYRLSNEITIETGIALYHFNRPKQSLTGDKSVKLNQKINFHSRVNYNLNSNLTLLPSVLYSTQGNDKELLLSCNAQYLLKDANNVILKSGFSNRWADAIIFNFGVEVDQFSTVVSYDINTSDLAVASNNKGGFEFALVYQWSIIKKKKRLTREHCPKYL